MDIITLSGENGLQSTAENIGSINSSLKFVRFYRMIKFSSILKSLKLSQEKKTAKKKEKNKFNLLEEFNINSAYKRLLKFVLGFIIFSHVLSCLWIYIGKMSYPNWIFDSKLQDKDDFTLYIAAFYFNWTTIFTVGYGDITPKNTSEIIFTLVLEFFGVLFFSYFISSLGYILLTYDYITMKYMKNMDILSDIKLNYDLDDPFYEKVSKFLNYDD